MNAHIATTLLPALRETALRQPDHLALIDGDKVHTYGELWQGVLGFAQVVQAHLTHGAHLAMIMDNGIDYVAAVYGTWAAAGVAVALNTNLKPDDLRWQVEHCQARVVVLGPRYKGMADLLQAMGLVVFHMVDGVLSRHDGGATPPLAPVVAQDPDAIEPAAIMYTSGTTGMPKGVVLTHGNLAANASSIQQALPMQPQDVALCLLPFFYAYGFSVLNSHISMGATLVLEHSMMYPLRVLERMKAWRVSAFYGVPSTFYLLLERGHLALAVEQGMLTSLRYCAQAGGAMDPDRITQVCALLPAAGFYVMYGQTEGSSRLTTLPAGELPRKPGSAGCAIQGVTLSVRNPENGQALPTGQTGEICAQGPNVMQGYWQAPQDTAQALRDGWLWTGDLGHLDADGFLYITGRSREIIKTGANRVSPWEIEQVIQAVPGVQEAAVIAAPDHLLGEVIQACILAPEIDHEELRRRVMLACKARLAPYKVPKYVVFVGELPRTASGKVRKHLLPIHPQPGHPQAS